jgi:hypothetical protein
MRALLFVALLASACGVEPCKKGTVLLSVTVDVPDAASLRFDVSVAGNTHTSTLSSAKSGTVEIDFGHYPVGQSIQVTVTAVATDGSDLASNSVGFTAAANCSSASISVGGSTGGGDGGDDMECVPTLTACPATVGCGKVDDGCGHTLDCGPCQVTSLSPTIGNTGDTISLEGTFGQSVDVDFGGGTKVSGTVLGPHRASFVVPNAGDGSIVSVSTGGAAAGALPFRRASFSLGVGAFRSWFEQENVARFTALEIGRSRFSQAVIGPFVYLIGGNVTFGPGSSGPTTTVSRSTLNADGTISPFTNVPSVALISKRDDAAAIVVGSTLYVIGGIGDTMLGSVERATIDATGNLSTFVTLPATGTDAVALTQPRYGFSTAVVGNYLYVIGGTTQVGIERSLERATISPTGTLGTFSAVPTTGAGSSQLAVGRSAASAVVIRNKLYVLGGTTASGDTASVDVADINPDGSLSTFVTLPSSGSGAVGLTSPRESASAIAIGHQVFVIGGSSNNAVVPTVEAATVDTTGALGAFTASSTTLGSARAAAGTLLVGNRLYLLGGNTGGLDSDVPSIEYSSVDASGAIATFTALPTTGTGAYTLPAPRMGYSVVTLGSYVYLIGGYETNVVATVLRATVQSDGTLSPFTQLPTTGANAVVLTAPRQDMALASTGNWLYVIGGDTGGTDPLKTVERAAINPDGTISSFSLVSGVNLVNQRRSFTAAIVGGLLYVIGGQMGGSNAYTVLNSLESASINADGSITTFGNAGTMTSARDNHRTAILGNYLYAIGGGSTNGSVERAPISSGSLGAFVALPTSGVNGVTQSTPRLYCGLAVTGPTALEVGGLGTALIPSIDSAAVGADGTLSTFGALGGGVSIAVPADSISSIILGNRLWVFGGNGNNGLMNIVQNAQLQ